MVRVVFHIYLERLEPAHSSSPPRFSRWRGYRSCYKSEQKTLMVWIKLSIQFPPIEVFVVPDVCGFESVH